MKSFNRKVAADFSYVTQSILLHLTHRRLRKSIGAAAFSLLTDLMCRLLFQGAEWKRPSYVNGHTLTRFHCLPQELTT